MLIYCQFMWRRSIQKHYFSKINSAICVSLGPARWDWTCRTSLGTQVTWRVPQGLMPATACCSHVRPLDQRGSHLTRKKLRGLTLLETKKERGNQIWMSTRTVWYRAWWGGGRKRKPDLGQVSSEMFIRHLSGDYQAGSRMHGSEFKEDRLDKCPPENKKRTYLSPMISEASRNPDIYYFDLITCGICLVAQNYSVHYDRLQPLSIYRNLS